MDCFRIVSPSHYEMIREITERKDSCTEDIRITVNGNVSKKPTADASSKTSTKSMCSISDQRFCAMIVVDLEEKKAAIIWGPTGVEPWSASMITGIDWKSLTIPASLPTTFDVVPTAEELQRDFTHNPYTLIHTLPPLPENDPKKKHLSNGHGNHEKNAW